MVVLIMKKICWTKISPKQMLATVTTEIELADAVYHRDTVLDPAAE